MSPQQTKGLLDRMMESARRFCVRSPILFRMSTQSSQPTYATVSITNFLSKQAQRAKAFKRLIIHMAASYYNSLNPDSAGMDKETQNIIRPRFLQMLTLLLSLLNEKVLKEMADFIHKTYGFIPNRADMELLFLRVIPLTSINSKMFLQGLIPAVEEHQCTVPPNRADSHESVWIKLMKRLAHRGYLLPGRVEDFGRHESSWIYKWPEGGVHSSTIFARLQYHGARSQTFNDVPTARFSYESDMAKITVILSNNETYDMRASDYEKISTMSPGHYTLTNEDGTISELHIAEIVLNVAINEAVRKINEAIATFNSRAQPMERMKRMLPRSRSRESIVFHDIESANRVTSNCAMLEGEPLAVAYKLHGKNVPKSLAIHCMMQYYDKVKMRFSRLCEAASRNITAYESLVGRVSKLFEQDRILHHAEKVAPRVSDVPITHAITTDDTNVPSAKVWYEYHVKVVRHRYGRDMLHVRARAYYVASVDWIHQGRQAEVILGNNQTKLFVAPLQPVPVAERKEEIDVGDPVLLMGRYMVIVELRDNDFRNPCIMVNWLEIQDANMEAIGRRRRNLNMQAQDQLPELISD